MSVIDTLNEPEVAEPIVKRPRHKPNTEEINKLFPPYAVIVLNDDDHSVEYVYELFRKVFGYSEQKCYLLTMEIHTKGQALVWSGPKEIAELKHDQIKGGGPDFYTSKKVDYPLGCFIEPLPG
jgi:ATP-dependent Clp protease adaptor protein ClpS